MLQFFVDFLDEHIELHKEKQWDTMQLEALKINFKLRFWSKSKMFDRIWSYPFGDPDDDEEDGE